MAKEKTKADLLSEINEKLELEVSQLKEEKNNLLAELRTIKSSDSLMVQKTKQFDAMEEELNRLKQDVEAKNNIITNCYEQLGIQKKQLDILSETANWSHNEILKTFEHYEYMLNLAKINYENGFAKYVGELNKINEEIENKNKGE